MDISVSFNLEWVNLIWLYFTDNIIQQKKSGLPKSTLCIIQCYAFLREGDINNWKGNTRGLWSAGDVLFLESYDDYTDMFTSWKIIKLHIYIYVLDMCRLYFIKMFM